MEPFIIDEQWLEKTSKENSSKENKLMSDLRMAMGAGNKDGIKNSSWELARHYNRIGCYRKASKHLKEILQYAMPSEVVTISQEILESALNESNYDSLDSTLITLLTPSSKTNTKHLEHSDESPLPYVSYCEALLKFTTRSWSCCLKILSELPLDQHDHIFNDIITPRDACLMVTVSAIFCYSREKIIKQVINNPNLCFILTSEPRMLNLLKCFQHSDFCHFARICEEALCVVRMNHYSAFCHFDFQRTLFLVALKEYLHSFSTAKIDRLMSTFQLAYDQLESLIFELNDSGELVSQIDWEKQLVHVVAKRHNPVAADRLVDGAQRIATWLEGQSSSAILKSNIECSLYKHLRNLP